jgi:FLVCR family feline leukemia virus subgroup C receptor-related protein
MFSLLSMSNAIQWISVPAVAITLQTFFGESSFAINAQSLLFMLIYIPAPLCAALTERKGLRFTLLLAALFNLLGALLRTIGSLDPSLFAVFVFGSIFAAVAQVGILAVPGLLSQLWFEPRLRPVATTIASMANQAGIALGFVVTPAAVQSGADFVRFQGGISVVCALLLLVLARFLPNVSSPAEKGAKSTRKDLLLLLRNRAFLCSTLAFGLATGVFYAWSTVLVQLSAEFQVSEADAAMQGFVMVSVGLFGGVGVAGVLSKHNQHATLYRGALLLATASLLVWCLGAFFRAPSWLGFVAVAVYGVCVTALVPIAIEIGTELSFPINSDLSTGVQFVAAQIVGILLIIVCTLLLESKDKDTVAVMCVLLVAMAIAAGASCVMKMEFRRQDAEAKANRQEHEHEHDVREHEHDHQSEKSLK